MRKVFIFKDGKWMEKENCVKVTQSPFIWSDLEGYQSPVGTGWVEGRAARREDLKRSGCREVAPSEFKKTN